MLLHSWVEVTIIPSGYHARRVSCRDCLDDSSGIIAIITTSAQGAGDSVIINEIYVSPNSEEYGGIDWNGMEKLEGSQSVPGIAPATDSAIDIGGWWIDDLENGGSPMS